MYILLCPNLGPYVTLIKVIGHLVLTVLVETKPLQEIKHTNVIYRKPHDMKVQYLFKVCLLMQFPQRLDNVIGGERGGGREEERWRGREGGRWKGREEGG